MTAIAGVFSFSDNADKSIMRNILAGQKHACGEKTFHFSDKQICIAQSNFNITFLEKENFPVKNKNESIICFVNGIIYNYLELKTLLEKKGYQFRTSGKFEIIPLLYEEFGKDCFSYLKGKFSIAIWDSLKKELILAVDRYSSKNLYYTTVNNEVLFSSEIKGLLKTKLFSVKPNWQEAYNQLTFSSVYGPDTLFYGVKKILGGMYVSFKKGSSSMNNYQIPITEKRSYSSSFLKDHRKKLLSAVETSLMEDKKTGVHLSGGVDSAILAYFAKEVLGTVNSYSIGYDGFENEGDSLYARETARILDINIKQKILRSNELEKLNKLMWISELPFSEGPVSTFHAFEMAKNKEKVILGGAGPETIYGPFLAKRFIIELFLSSRGFKFLRPDSLKTFLLNYSNFTTPHLRMLRRIFIDDYFEGALDLIGGFDECEKRLLFANPKILKTSQHLKNVYEKYNIKTDIVDFVFLNNLIMEKNSRFSAFSSLEISYPFLDSNFTLFMEKIPSFQKSLFSSKSALKRVMSIPRKILHRKKEGFILPTKFYSEQKDFLYSKLDSLSQRKEFNKKGIERLKNSINAINYWYKIQHLATLESWFEVFIDQDLK